MPVRDIIVIGASAGGLDAVRTVVNAFPRTLRASVFIVIHTAPDGPGLLAEILNRSSHLPIKTAKAGISFEHGHVYVAPPDAHLLLEDGYVRLSRGPREHRFRPAIDPLFRTAAQQFKARVIGVVLSGNLADGSHGLLVVKQNGGVAIVQDPEEALAPSMPENAILHTDVDYVLPAGEIGRVITGLVMNGHDTHTRGEKGRQKKTETPNAEEPGTDALETGSMPGPPSPFTCPDCGGTLWEIKNGDLVRYRCHVGHGFTEQSLSVHQETKLEDTLWSALRAIEESIELRKRMAARAETRNLRAIVPSLERDIADYELRAEALRDLLLRPAGNGNRRQRRSKRRQPANGSRKKR